ncbi:HYC_CC_PP family protein [Maribacter sp. X9]|uniref:HYC_CC_PP family protein n=1 Tax=Maribacter sp. X9 TaxID=3402159 RepID=UPI003AF3DAD6
MKRVVHKIASLSMALLVLFSTLSFSVDMHYCMGDLVDFSLFDDVKTCSMQMDASESSSMDTTMEMAMDCCSDVQLNKVGQDDLKISFDTISFDQQVFLTSFVYTYFNLYAEEVTDKVRFEDYAPPLLIRDTLILDQTFLI